jgi:hypothetical protein
VSVDVEAVVFGRAIAQLRDVLAVMPELLHAEFAQTLIENVIPHRRRTEGVGIEPAHVPSVVFQRNKLGLHLIAAVVVVGESEIERGV